MNAGTFNLSIGYNSGVPGTPVQFADGTFVLGGGSPCPTLYRDIDGDGFGALSSGSVVSCTPVTGYVSNNTDCDDTRFLYADNDGDTYGAGPAVACGVQLNTDCNNTNAAIYPGAPELCATSTVDNNCNGVTTDVDTNAVDKVNFFRDQDLDSYSTNVTATFCPGTTNAGYVAALSNPIDCNDTNPVINPATVWYSDSDGDGLGVASAGTLTQCASPLGYSLVNGDNCPTIANPNQADCNSNSIGDVCELASGALLDCDGDLVPDICEGAVLVDANSPLLAPFGNGVSVAYTFNALPQAYGGPVELSIDAIADLNLDSEFIAVSINGGPQEYYFVTDGNDCPTTPDHAVKSFTVAAFNALAFNGTLRVNIVASGTVSATQCANGGIRLGLKYAGIPASSDCNGNIILDSCEIATGAAADCDQNGTIDSCDLASGEGADCNGNEALDSCEIASGSVSDLDGNGIPDNCTSEFIVGGSGYASVQSAIAAAPTGATVRVAPGNYAGPIVLEGKSLTLIAIGNASNTTISGAGLSTSILTIRGAAAIGSTISGFQFRDGTAGSLESGARVGGAMLLSETTASIRDCIFTGNSAFNGGAIYGNAFSGIIEQCSFISNTATNDAGAVQLGFGGVANFRANVLETNHAGRNGGAMLIVNAPTGPLTSITVQNSQFRTNSAIGLGGALAWDASSGDNLPVFGCTIESNTAADAALSRIAGALSFELLNTRLCMNTPTNVVGPVVDLGGNSFGDDCNGNGQCDADEIAAGSESDCNSNGIPDSCEVGGIVSAWGDNGLNQATPPSDLGPTVQVLAGCSHSLALLSDGSMRAWGYDSFGQTTIPPSIGEVRTISVGCDHNLALRLDGTVMAWGYNAYGQCNVPGSLNAVAQIAAGANHSAALRTSGAIVMWGRNLDGACDVPADVGAVKAIALGGSHSMALRTDGSVRCWGLNNFGQCDVPGSVGTLKAIAAGCYHSIGLRTNGTVSAWGSSMFGQTIVPGGLSNVVAIAAGSGQHTIALKLDGSVACWGWNAFGQTTVPTILRTVGQVTAGGTHTLVVSRGAADCDSNGQIDSCEFAAGTAVDCNANGVIDRCDIAAGAADCNGNFVPDSCEFAAGAPDCNANSVLDSCELASGSATDCDGGGVLDSCEIAAGASDCNSNGLPDTCDIAAGSATDCNGNGILDVCDITSGSATDCNSNQLPDSCDLASGASTDLNGNGILDECANEFVVGGSGFANIGAAIAAAPSGTTIRVGTGIYTGPIVIEAKAITLVSISGASSTILSGTGLSASIVTVRGPGTDGTVIDGFNFQHGVSGTTAFGTRVGGALLLERCNAIVRNCNFADNAAPAGGAIYGRSFSGAVQSCSFEHNNAGSTGGAIELVKAADEPSCASTIVDCSMVLNSALGRGGAISLNGISGFDTTISGCTIESNTAGDAAISCAAGTVAFSLSNTRLCLNTPSNIVGDFVDLGGNTLSQDCNDNGICDSDEIASGAASDCNSNGFPDACEIGGAVTAWGDSTAGATTVPTNVVAVTQIAAGCSHSIALKPDGTVTGWGSNAFGQAATVTGLSINKIVAGCDHNMALLTDGTVRAWGYNAFGQTDAPSSLVGVVDIAAGANHSGARRADGSIALWGRNIEGQCDTPADLGSAAQLALGGAHSIARRSDGSILCWGLNNFGQCTVPNTVGNLVSIAAGCYHSVGLRANGTVLAWGSSMFGQTSVPIDLTGVVKIAAGSGQHTLALLSDGTVRAWGWNAFGQSSVPATIGDAADISAGGAHSMIRTRGSADCNGNGTIDSCEIADGSTADCNGNGIPDSCDLLSGQEVDCNANGQLDSCEIASGAVADCNANGKPDSCDIAAGTVTDLNGNGVPDGCAGEYIVGGTGYSTIQSALAAAPSGATVLVAPGTYHGPIVVDSKLINLISLGGAGVTTISGTSAGFGASGSILALRGALANGSIIDGFTFRDGTTGTAAFDGLVGGALLLESCTATVRNCAFLDNSAEQGGAIYARAFSGAFEQCVFQGNSATVGGGALLWYAQANEALAITGCTVESNTAPDAAFTHDGTRAFDVIGSRFCLNTPTNFSGAVNDLGGNIFSQDCNGNGICDADEIASGAEADCDSNGIPDSCQIRGQGFAWGDDPIGQTNIPGDLARAVEISAGCDHNLALLADGTLLAWGGNFFGQGSVPSDVGLARSIAAGCDFNMVLRTDGTVYNWGNNAYGQLVVPPSLAGVVEIAAGGSHAGARRGDGSIALWGRNSEGQCTVPGSVEPVVEIALGGAHTMARRADGSVAAWGLNNFGQTTVPNNVGTLGGIAAGCYHSVGLRTDGTVVVWGANLFGQLNVPPGLNNVVDIAAGSSQHTVALKGDGTVVAWGWNAFGQSTVPAALPPIALISAGGAHTLVFSRTSADCNDNNQLDSCEIAAGSVTDCNGNGAPDSCDISRGSETDCNGNGFPDSCEITQGSAIDCNGNALPDTCDLASGSSSDLNSNGIPDDCSGEFIVGGSGYTNIQAAIDAAPNGSTIRVGPGAWAPFELIGRGLIIESLNGGGVTSIDGANSGTCISMTGIGPRAVVIRGFTIEHGAASSGAGIKLLLSAPVFIDCTIRDNVATGNGGAIACYTSNPLFQSCTITNNSASQGGGVFAAGATTDGSFAQFDQCVFTNNHASGAGGALYNTAAVAFTQCNVEFNIAGTSGGGTWTLTGATTLIGDSFFCMNEPDNTVGPIETISPNILGEDCNNNGICDIDEIAGGAEDKNANNLLDTCELATGDLNLDGQINGADLTTLLNFWGAVNPPAGDLNGDGVINGYDMTILLNNWGPG